MVKRCIMIFPRFDNVEVIDRIRVKYDPLAKHVMPHITLVFPFDSNIGTDDLKVHMESILEGIEPFELVLNGIKPVKSHSQFLFLNIKKGLEIVTEIHEKLYTGILEQYYPKWLKKGYYLPHMTVGKIDDDNIFKEAVNETKGICDVFSTVVNKISVENIDENENSVIELEIPLK